MVFVFGFGLCMPNFLHFPCLSTRSLTVFVHLSCDQLHNHWKTCHCKVLLLIFHFGLCFLLPLYVGCKKYTVMGRSVCEFISLAITPLSRELFDFEYWRNQQYECKTFRTFLIIAQTATETTVILTVASIQTK